MEVTGQDPIDAPSHHYKERPGKPGRLVWISGPPGLGKSTSAQLLARDHHFVYYEADCFYSFRNPYIPAEVPDPTMHQVKQKSLRGPGLMQRIEIVNRGNKEYENLVVRIYLLVAHAHSETQYKGLCTMYLCVCVSLCSKITVLAFQIRSLSS